MRELKRSLRMLISTEFIVALVERAVAAEQEAAHQKEKVQVLEAKVRALELLRKHSR